MRILLALLVAASASVHAAEPVAYSIPLKDVWAYHMPDTQKLPSDKVYPLMAEISKNWSNDSGLAVQAEGVEALDEIAKIKIDHARPGFLQAGKPISLVFITRECGFYAHVRFVERHGQEFTISYQFVPHYTQDSTRHLAIIPVGTLEAGKYLVRIKRLPLDKEWYDRGYSERARRAATRVCQSFEFVVKGFEP